MTNATENSISLNNINFSYPGCEPFIQGCSIHLPRGAKCLLIGANGAGKTTLLQLIAGKYMVGKDSILVLGRSPFHDTALTCSGQLSYLGTSWRKDVAFAGYGVQLQGDISAGKMIFGVEGVDPDRRSRLVQLLDIDLYQRITTMSDGQRRRVQICMGLLKPYEVLLLDEITVDLDVVGRLALLKFFDEECSQRGATIIYATHIFDGMEDWISHIAYLESGKIMTGGPKSCLPTLSANNKLLHVVEAWLRTERDKRHEAMRVAKAARDAAGLGDSESIQPLRTPMMPSKHLAFFR